MAFGFYLKHSTICIHTAETILCEHRIYMWNEENLSKNRKIKSFFFLFDLVLNWKSCVFWSKPCTSYKNIECFNFLCLWALNEKKKFHLEFVQNLKSDNNKKNRSFSFFASLFVCLAELVNRFSIFYNLQSTQYTV